MLKELSIIPQTILQLLQNSFSDHQLLQAKKLLFSGQITISFKKGQLDKYFIVSGIIKEGKTYEVRLSFKGGQFKSNCTCLVWNEERHCHHIVALFLKFFLQTTHQENQESSDNSAGHGSNSNTTSSFKVPLLGVHVEEYGTIIDGPHRFLGGLGSTSYSHHQYVLSDQKTVVNFPLPQNFHGILKVNSYMKSVEVLGPNLENGHQELLPLKTYFSLVNPEGKELIQISLFESLYLFDWEQGITYHLPNDLKELVRKIRQRGIFLNMDDLLKFTTEARNKNLVQLTFQGIPIEKIDHREAHLKIFVGPDPRKNQMLLKIGLFDSNNQALNLPRSFFIMAFEQGFLSSFRRKIDAFDFLKGLIEHLKGEASHSQYQQYLRLSSRRTALEESAQTLIQSKVLDAFNPESVSLGSLPTSTLQNLLLAIYECFGLTFFRTSAYNSAERIFQFELTTTSLLQNISLFYTKMQSSGIDLYYNNMPLTLWKTALQATRRKGPLDWFDLQLSISQEDLDILKNMDPTKNYAFTSKGLVLLSSDQKNLVRFLKKYTKFEDDSSKKNNEEGGIRKFTIPFHRARIFELFELQKLGLQGALTDEEIALCHQLSTLKEMPCFPVPGIIDAVPRPYQITGFQWLRFLYENKLGACLADDMGLGKTLQIIMFIKSLTERLNCVLIVCPVSIIINWMNEFKKFVNLDVALYYGGERQFPKDAKIILTSYGVMKKEAEGIFKDIHFDILVLDEVQNLKNIKSLGAIAARKINAGFRICVTGTPVENHLAEFYNILDLCIPGLWGTGGSGGLGGAGTSKQFFLTQEDNLHWAKKMARPFILRRTKAQVLTDLPEKINNLVFLNFSDEERKKYLSALLFIRTRIQTTILQRRYGEILKGLLELRKLCLWQPTETPNKVSSTKISFLMENLEQILDEGHQSIVFSQFTTYLDIIQKEVEKNGWKFSRIDGGQSIQKRQREVDLFQKGDNRLFLIGLKAGGVGLNLTAASYVFLMDPWWNPAVESQAIDRAHRIGQKNKLTVYRPVIKDSVEEKVLNLQKVKRELFDELLSDQDESFFSGKLTLEDFEGLFN